MHGGNEVMSKDAGIKYDQEKLRYDLIPTEVMEALAHIYTMGAVKYGPHNWERGIAWSRIIGATFRHLYSWLSGKEIDEESGKSHLWHVLWNVAALVTYEQRKVGTDDRACKNPELPGFGHKPVESNETPKIKTTELSNKNNKVFTVNYSLPEDYLTEVNTTPNISTDRTKTEEFYIPDTKSMIKEFNEIMSMYPLKNDTQNNKSSNVLLIEE